MATTRTENRIRIKNTSAYSVRPAKWEFVETIRYSSSTVWNDQYVYRVNIGGTYYYDYRLTRSLDGQEVGDNIHVFRSYTKNSYGSVQLNGACLTEYFSVQITSYTYTFTSDSGCSAPKNVTVTLTTGQQYTATATPNSNRTVVGWNGGTQGRSITVTAGSSQEGTYTAATHITTYHVTVNCSPNGYGGRVDASLSSITPATTKTSITIDVPYERALYIYAPGIYSSRFKGWADAPNAGNNRVVYPTSENQTYTAIWATTYVKTSVNSSSYGSAYIGLSGNVTTAYFLAGDSVTVRAIPKDQSTIGFLGWYANNGNTPVSTNSIYSFVYGGANITLTARFANKTKRYTVTRSDTRYGYVNIWHGDISGGSAYDAPWNVTITLQCVVVDRDEVVDGETIHVRGVFEGWYRASDTQFTNPVSLDPDFRITVPANDYEQEDYVAKVSKAKVVTVISEIADDGDPPQPHIDRGTIEVTRGAVSDIENNKYYTGPMAFLVTPLSGFHVGGWLVNGSQILGASGNELEYNVTGEGEIDEYTIQAIVIENTYQINVNLDSASIGCGAIAVKTLRPDGSPDDPLDWISPTDDIVAHGAIVRVVVTLTPDTATNRAFRKLTSRDEVLATFPLGENQWAYEFVADSERTFTAFFGGTFTVKAKRQGTPPTWTDEEYGTVGAYLAEGDAPSGAVEFTYGESINIVAIDHDVEGQEGYFVSWHKYENATVSSRLSGIAASASVTPAVNGENTAHEYWAEFQHTREVVFIHLSNSGTTHGVLSAVALDNDAYLKEISPTEFDESLDEYYGVEGTAVPTGRADKFYEVVLGKRILLVCAENNQFSAPFDAWTLQFYTERNTFDSASGVNYSNVASVEFVATGNAVLSATYNTTTASRVIARYANGSSVALGRIYISPISQNHVENDVYTYDDIIPGTEVTLYATPKNGYKFAGWYGEAEAYNLISESSTYSFEKRGATDEVFAKFIQDVNAVYEWEGASENKMMTWRSRRTRMPQPVNFASAAIDADGYPVTLKVHYASSPEPAENGFRTSEITIDGQDSRRMPLARPEKFIEIEVQADHQILGVALSGSAHGLLR